MNIDLTKSERNFIELLVTDYMSNHYGSTYPRSAGWYDECDSLLLKLKGGETND